MKTQPKQKKIKAGRPLGSGGKHKPNPNKKFKNISPFSGESLRVHDFQKEKTCYDLLKKRNLLQYMKVKDDFENNETLKAISVIKGIEVKDLIQEIIQTYIKDVKEGLETNKKEEN